MVEKLAAVAKAPCKSCPYRCDVPSGLWDASEYDKLPRYDGSMVEQAIAGAGGLFMCHQQDGNLCAGWVAAHGAHNLLAFRLNGGEVHPAVWAYESPVPVFSSGREACDHGQAHVADPDPRARRAILRLLRKQTGRLP